MSPTEPGNRRDAPHRSREPQGWRALFALDVDDERALAASLAGALYLTGALCMLLLLPLPGTQTRYWPVVIAAAVVGVVWGLTCLLVIRGRLTRGISLASSAGGFPVVAIAMAATGGASSPARFFLFFTVFYCAYFYTGPQAALYILGCIVVEALPLLYDTGAVREGFVGELVVVSATFVVLGALIAAGKRVLIRLHQRAHDLSLEDPLTGLANRRALVDFIDAHAGTRAPDGQRASDCFGLLIIDLDDFKQVNTVFGHPGGDACLIAVGDALRQVARDGDVVARLGGDEFAVAAPGITSLALAQLGKRVVTAVAESINELETIDVSLTASAGSALYPDDGRDWSSLLADADGYVRRAKKSGKNTAGRSMHGRAALSS